MLALPGLLAANAAAYDWPVRPFNVQHPVRSVFNDPRRSVAEDGTPGESFHSGIDICTEDGEAVYAIEPGTVSLRRSAVVVTGAARHRFGYWHVVPAVTAGEWVTRHQLIGYVAFARRHVHLSESIDGAYVNPLRRGGIAPFVDETAPTVTSVLVLKNRKQVDLSAVSGSVDVAVDAYDTPPLPPPTAWDESRVAPALLRWRLLDADGLVVPWQIGLDFLHALLPQSLFDSVYAPETRENRASRPGFYRLYVLRDLDLAPLPPGLYVLQVEALDTRSNVGRGSVVFRVADQMR